MKITLENVSKKIHGVHVLKNISLTFNSGTVYGLSGANGCGKTMLMRVISGLIRVNEGCVLIDDKKLGIDIDFPPSIGVLIENPSFLPNLTGFKNLRLLADLVNDISNEEIEKTLQTVGLQPRDKRAFRKYSLGMKQRLGIAGAILGNPKIIILDEPLNALDVKSVEIVRDLIKSAKQSGAIVILACHDKDEIVALSDEIIYMENGLVVSKNASATTHIGIEVTENE